MGNFRTVFENYGGEYIATMERFLGNEKMYVKLLNMLFQDENMEKLGKALEAGNRPAAFEAAHTLKGVAGNLGLKPLYDAVCEIVEPLRAGEERSDYPRLYQAVQAEFQRAEDLRKELEAVL